MNRKQKERLYISIIFIIGLLIMTYPLSSNAFNTVWDNINMRKFYKQEKERFLSEKSLLEKRNLDIANGAFAPGSDPFETGFEDKIADSARDHFLGSINIPKLNLDIPLYDKTSASLLEIGATVLDGTSLPLGGENTHSVITGHRGLPNRELFTNISKLVTDDIFVIDVFGEKMAYKVISSEVVLPHETDKLNLVPGEDLVTLITCTPYMINTHRLLVTGTRVELTETISTDVSSGITNQNLKNITVLLFLVVLIVSFTVYLIRLFIVMKENRKR